MLVVDDGEVPPGVYDQLEHDGWICAHTPDVASALVVLHQVRPALVLIGHVDDARDQVALRALHADPFMAGVKLEVLRDAGEGGGLAEQLKALLAAP